MRIQVNSDLIKDKLKVANTVAERSEGDKITHGLYLIAKNGKLTIKSTNTNLELTLSMGCDIEEEGSAITEASLFSSYIGKIKGKDIEIYSTSNNLIIEDKNNKVKLPVYNSNSYPSPRAVNADVNFTIDGNKLKKIIDRTLFVIPSKPNNAILGTLYLNAKEDGLVEFVATDTFHLAYVGEAVDVEKPQEFSITRETVQLINKLDIENEMIKFTASDHSLLIEGDSFELTSQYISGKYPNYNSVLPDGEFDMHSYPLPSDMEETLDKGLLLSGETNAMKLDFKNDYIEIFNKDKELGYFEDKVEHNLDGKELDIALNGKNLLSALKKAGSDMVLNLNEGIAPLVLTEDNWTYLVMPIRQ